MAMKYRMSINNFYPFLINTFLIQHLLLYIRTTEVVSCARDEKSDEDKEKPQDEYSSFLTSSDDEEEEVDSKPKRKRKRRIKKVKY